MGKSDHLYLAKRAAEELAAAQCATSDTAAGVHRELSLRYSLKLILPEPASAGDDAWTGGQPKRPPANVAATAPKRRAPARSRA